MIKCNQHSLSIFSSQRELKNKIKRMLDITTMENNLGMRREGYRGKKGHTKRHNLSKILTIKHIPRYLGI